MPDQIIWDILHVPFALKKLTFMGAILSLIFWPAGDTKPIFCKKNQLPTKALKSLSPGFHDV